jgi:hypothetical protein
VANGDDIPGGGFDWVTAWQTGQYSQAMLDAVAGGYGGNLPSQDVLGAAISTTPPPSYTPISTETPPTPTHPDPPIYTPGPGPLSPGELSQVLGEAPPSLGWPGWGFAGSLGSFFRKGARRPSQFERLLSQGQRSLTKAITDALKSAAQTGRNLRVVDRAGTLARKPFFFGPLGLPLTIVGALIVSPKPLRSGELRAGSPVDWAAPGVNLYDPATKGYRFFPEMKVTRPMRGQAFPPTVGTRYDPMMQLVIDPNFGERPGYDTRGLIDRAVSAVKSEVLRRVAPALEPFTRSVDIGPPGPPRPVKQITIGPQSETPTAPVPGPVPRRSPRWGIGIGAILAGLTVEGLQSQRGATRGSVPTTTPTVPVVTAPVQSPQPSVSLGFSSASSWNTFSGSQYCEPRPRGPRRKCLQRAPVRYSGGPRKGKAAGTKCIRYAARKA